MEGPSSLLSRQDREAISHLSSEPAGLQTGKGLSMPSALDTAFVEMMEHATFDWPERLAGERVRSGDAKIGATGVALAGLAVVACRAIGFMMRDRRSRIKERRQSVPWSAGTLCGKRGRRLIKQPRNARDEKPYENRTIYSHCC